MAAVQKYQSLGEYDKVLQDFYEGMIRAQLNDALVLFKLLEKRKGKYAGRKVVFPVHVARSRGIGPVAEYGDLPTPQRQGHVESRIGYTKNYLVIELTADVIKVSEKDEGAFANAMTVEMERGVLDLKKDMNRQVWGKGDGTLATVSSANVGPALTVDSTRFLMVGDVIEIWKTTDNGSTPSITSAEIDTVDSATQVTLTAALGVATDNGSVIKRKGAGLTKTTSIELTGLQKIVDDGTVSAALQTISGTTHPVWKSHVKAVGGALSTDVLQRAIDKVYRDGGSDVDVLAMDVTLRREYVNLVQSNIRYKPVDERDPGFTNESLHYTGGKKPLPIVTDTDAPYGLLVGLSRKNIKFYELCDFEWAKEDGSILQRHATKDAFQARMRHMGDIGTDKRNAHFKLTGLTYTAE